MKRIVMKRLLTLLASLLLVGSTAAVAQEYVSTPVTLSKEKCWNGRPSLVLPKPMV